MTNYDQTPNFLWYSAQGNPPTNKVHWWKGVKYVGYEEEPDPHILDQYKLTYIGMGDVNYIEGVR